MPISEPHWLAGMTRRRVTGGLETFPPFAGAAQRSWAGRLWFGSPCPCCSPSRGRTCLLGCEGEKPSPGPTLMKEPGPPWVWPSLPPAAPVWNPGPGNHSQPPSPPATDLIQLEGDHGDRMEDSRCRPCDGGDALGAGALRDGDPGAALRGHTTPGGGAPSPLPCQEPVCLPPYQAPAHHWKQLPSKGTHYSSQMVGSREKGGAGISPPLQTRCPGQLSQTPASPAPGFALQSLLSVREKIRNGS